MKSGPKILFICTGNSCRSQMAEGFARALAPPGVVVGSAGVRADGMNRFAIQVMAERGIDITRQRSKSVENREFEPDTVVTLSARAAHEIGRLPEERQRLHWALPDPMDARGDEAEILAVYRAVRDDIENRLKTYFTQKGG